MKKQIIVIHGGDTFNNYDEWFEYLKTKKLDFERMKASQVEWKALLQERLGDDYEVILPQMPNKQNSKYAEWKIWFETMTPFFDPTVIFIGHSLGGIFLAKYLSENNFSKKIIATILVAAPFDKESDYSLGDFRLPPDLSNFERQGGEIFLYHSKDDPVVPYSDFEKYKKVLPAAVDRIFDNRGHFNQENLPEIIEDIRKINYL